MRFLSAPITTVVTVVSLLFFSCNSSPTPPAPAADDAAGMQLPDVASFSDVSEAISAADSNNEKGIDLHQDKPAEAIEYFKKSIAIRNNIPTEKPVTDEQQYAIFDGIVKGYFNIALCYKGLNQYAQARLYINKSLEQIRQFEKEGYRNPRRIARAYHDLGTIDLQEGNVQAALNAFRDESAYWDQMPDNDSNKQEGVFSRLSDMSAAYIQRRDADSIIRFAQAAINLATGNNQISFQIGHSYNNLGYAFILKKDYPQAVQNLDKAIDYFEAAGELDDKALALHNKAMALRLMRRFDEAHQNADQAIAYWQGKGTTAADKNNLAGNLCNKADIFMDQGEYAQAQAYYEKSIPLYYAEGNSHEPDASTLVYDKPGLVEAYAGKAEALKFSGSNDKAMLAYNQAIELINRFKQSYDDAGSKAKLAEITKKVFEGAIATGLKAGVEFSQLLSYSEQSKAFILLESIKKQQIVAGIDPELLKREKELRTDILWRERQLMNESNPDSKVQLVEQLKSRQSELATLLKKLNANERYRQLNEGMEAPSVDEIRRKLLDDDQMMIEYFVGENKTYIFVIPPKGEPKVYEIAVGQLMMTQLVQSCLAGIYGEYDPLRAKALVATPPNNDYTALYAESGSALHSVLMPNAIQDNKPQRLLIIPDDVLGYLPFDALLTNPPMSTAFGQYRQYPFLGLSHSISYSYSAALLKEMKQSKRRHKHNKLFAFAYPGELDFFTAQVDQLKTLWGEKRIAVVNDNDAENLLKQDGGHYRFVHLATHGSVNDRDPDLSYLLMRNPAEKDQDSCLYLYELYGMALNADMVFTSACEAGIGQLYRGEGIMSLARGFSYAGAGSIVTTLWKINQQKANTVVESFYKSLLEDKTRAKDEALYEAKKAYFNSAGHRDAAPYFWASFIPIGDMAPVKQQWGNRQWLWGLLLVLFALRAWRRHRNKATMPQ